MAFFGLSGATTRRPRTFLVAHDTAPVEPPVVEEVLAPPGVTVRRAVSYSQPDAALFVQVRYVVDNAHPEAVVYVQSGNRNPGPVIGFLDDLDSVVERMSVAGSAR